MKLYSPGQQEFLSGFRKGDKLIPVITAVIYFGAEEWDAPLSIHEMLDVDEELLPFIPDYRINLIAPANIPDSHFSTKESSGRFHTGFGTLMQVIKHQNEIGVADILSNAPKIDEASADMIAEVANIKFEKAVDEKGEVDMCKAVEEYTLKTKVLALIDYLTGEGIAKEEIIQKITNKYPVTAEYVEELMAA